jgi:hypothetical protein
MFKQRSANELHDFRINETFHGCPLLACHHGGTHDARPLQIVGVAIPPLNVTVQRGHEIDRRAAGLAPHLPPPVTIWFQKLSQPAFFDPLARHLSKSHEFFEQIEPIFRKI